MNALELLHADGVVNYLARMADGTYRWVSPGLYLLPGGPAPAWVEQRLRVNNSRGQRSIRRVSPAHDILLATLNANSAIPLAGVPS